jgi:hypothetical protein
MVRTHPDPPAPRRGDETQPKFEDGGLAQLGEHLLCKQGVVGSIPSSSTNQTAEYRRLKTDKHRAAERHTAQSVISLVSSVI